VIPGTPNNIIDKDKTEEGKGFPSSDDLFD
jgi:hypothetical protein